MKLIVGLGNPGPGYSGNRHNVGFMCVNHFAKVHGLHFDKKKANSRVAEGQVGGISVVLARPQTYMNESGKAVNALMRKLRIGLDDVIVVHDDLDLPLGRIRIRKGGSSGGHKGVQSIIAEAGGADFVRVRVGIGRPSSQIQDRRDVIDFVLTNFLGETRSVIEKTVPRVAEALECLLSDGLTAAMNVFNTTPAPEPP